MNLRQLKLRLKNILYNLKDEEETYEPTYANMLGLNREIKFIPTKTKVADEKEFIDVCKEAEKLLEQDLKRLGKPLSKIQPVLKNTLNGTIGSMTLICDDDGEITVKFHRRDVDFYWDEKAKKFPEKNATGKYIHNTFFVLEDDEDED